MTRRAWCPTRACRRWREDHGAQHYGRPATVVSTVTVPVGSHPPSTRRGGESDHVPVDNRREDSVSIVCVAAWATEKSMGAEVDAMKFVSPG